MCRSTATAFMTAIPRDEGLQNLHTHVFIAGTIENDLGERESHRVNREQVVADARSLERPDNLHHIARQEFETLLDRTMGKAWRLEREAMPEQEQEQRSSRFRAINVPSTSSFRH